MIKSFNSNIKLHNFVMSKTNVYLLIKSQFISIRYSQHAEDNTVNFKQMYTV